MIYAILINFISAKSGSYRYAVKAAQLVRYDEDNMACVNPLGHHISSWWYTAHKEYAPFSS